MSTPTDEARELAKRWAWWEDGGGIDTERPESLAAHEGGVFWARRLVEMRFPDADRERLFAWVRDYAKLATVEGLDPADVAGNLAIELDLGDGDAFDERAARDLLRAAGWPS